MKLLFFLPLLLIACAPVAQVVGNQTVSSEVTRLQSLAANQTITPNDLENISRMVAADKVAADELREAQAFVEEKEFLHASHSLGYIAEYLQTGKRQVCPDHELAHYYIFSKHGASDLAADALKNAEDDFPSWQANVHPDNSTGTDEALIAQAREYFLTYDTAIENGNTSISSSELNFLTFLGGVCSE